MHLSPSLLLRYLVDNSLDDVYTETSKLLQLMSQPAVFRQLKNSYYVKCVVTIPSRSVWLTSLLRRKTAIWSLYRMYIYVSTNVGAYSWHRTITKSSYERGSANPSLGSYGFIGNGTCDTFNNTHLQKLLKVTSCSDACPEPAFHALPYSVLMSWGVTDLMKWCAATIFPSVRQ